ncbi:MAG TPA: alpha/beta hydrolase [Mycobacterium sp.]
MVAKRESGYSRTRSGKSAVRRRVHRRRSPQSFVVSLAGRLIVKNAVRVWTLQPSLQWPFESVEHAAGLLPHDRPHAKIDRVRLTDCDAEWIRAQDTSPNRVILYLHGGAFLTCGLNTHRSLVTRLSRAADAAVLNVAYRMLPAHRLSDAIDDALSGLRWLFRRGYPADRIVVAGDSAGGYLAFMTTLLAMRNRLGKPAGIATVSPFTNTNPVRHNKADSCAIFPRGVLPVFTRYLRERRGRAADRVASPVDADLAGLPPVTIHASSDELLLGDSELMAQRLEAASVRCDLHLWDGQVHDFPLAADVLPEGRRAIRYIGDFVKDVTGEPEQDPAQAA